MPAGPAPTMRTSLSILSSSFLAYVLTIALEITISSSLGIDPSLRKEVFTCHTRTSLPRDNLQVGIAFDTRVASKVPGVGGEGPPRRLVVKK